MSKKIPEIILKAKALDGKLIFNQQNDVYAYCVEHSGEDLMVHFEPEAQVSPKMKLYAFYYANILECAVVGYTYAGWEAVDKVKADYLLRAELAKDFIKRPDGTYEPIMLDKKNMSKARLLKLVQDAIFFIENDLQVRVAGSDEYKLMKATKREFKKVG